MNRLLRGKTIKMYEEDVDLLEDVIIENSQAIEMAEIYGNIKMCIRDRRPYIGRYLDRYGPHNHQHANHGSWIFFTHPYRCGAVFFVLL